MWLLLNLGRGTDFRSRERTLTIGTVTYRYQVYVPADHSGDGILNGCHRRLQDRVSVADSFCGACGDRGPRRNIRRADLFGS